jgi:hypothetical protein
MCGYRHIGVCWKLRETHVNDHPLSEDASNQDETPEPARLDDAAPSLITPDIEPVEPSGLEDASCKHSRRNKECVACECGCGECHRPGKKCKKQKLKEEKKASKKRKADDVALEDDADDADDAGIADNTADGADNVDDADVMDVVEIADDEEMKDETSASPSKPTPQPKKKRKKEAKKKVKDTSGRWYNAIIVKD